MTSPRWPFPYGLLLALAQWGAIVALGLYLVSSGAWALSLAMNIMGAK